MIAGNGEGSGLIDVRALAAMVAPKERAPAPAPKGRVHDLAAAPLLVAPAPIPVAMPARSIAAAPTQTPLYYMIGALALGMMALVTLMVSQSSASTGPVREVYVPVAAPAAERVAQAEPEEPEEVEEPEVERASAVAASESEPEPVKPVIGSASKGPRKNPKKPVVGAPAEQNPPAERPKVPAVSNEPAADSVACLLGHADCKKPQKAPAPVIETPPAVPSSSLPEKLEPADISDGTRAAKAAALGKCKALARGGEIVTIKLSIAGPEGAVLSAAAQNDAGNPQLAACCADELAKSSFKKVQKAQIGAVATLKF